MYGVTQAARARTIGRRREMKETLVWFAPPQPLNGMRENISSISVYGPVFPTHVLSISHRVAQGCCLIPTGYPAPGVSVTECLPWGPSSKP